MLMLMALIGGQAPSAQAVGPHAVRPGFDAVVLGATDDGSSGLVPIGFPIDFFDTVYTQLFVNNNGSMTFDASFTFVSTPSIPNLSTINRVMMTPFFADVDTGVGHVVTYGQSTVNGRPAFGVTWPGVGCYSQNISVLNIFQAILIDRSDTGVNNFDIEFNYDQMQWESGQGNGGDTNCRGGFSARAGYTHGTGTPGTFFELPGSGVGGAFLDSNLITGLIHNSLNSGDQLGRYVLPIRQGQPVGFIELAPHTATNHAGTEHTVTATVRNFDLTPLEGAPIEFEVVSGPNAGVTGTETSNADGEATFTYTGVDGPGGAGIDVIQASFVDPTGTLVLADPVTAEWVTCLIYAVRDPKYAAQFFVIDLYTLAVTPIGPEQSGRNIEGMALHPTTNTLYAASGKYNTFGQKGFLFTVDGETGTLTPVGPTGYTGVEALAFRPTDGVLWGWAEGTGLVTLDLNTGATTLVLPSTIDIEGMAWNNDGTLLYGGTGSKLYVYNPISNTLTKIATNLPRDTKALEMRQDGLLAIGTNVSSSVYTYDVTTKQLVPTAEISTPYNEIEGIAWPRLCTP
jgi:hypothetical protein